MQLARIFLIGPAVHSRSVRYVAKTGLPRLRAVVAKDKAEVSKASVLAC